MNYLIDVCLMRVTVLLLSSLLAVTATNPQRSSQSHPDAPVFVIQLDPVYYVVKGRPVTLTCRAAPAIQISVKCGGQWISPADQVINSGQWRF